MNCVADECLAPPDVCANVEDSKEQHLLAHKTDEGDNVFQRNLKRDKALLIAIAAMVVLMRIPFVKYILYPFMLFSTWVHEMCHGMAAILVGGNISSLYVYADGSGLAKTGSSGQDWKRVIVASAGYTGTALIGGLLLLWRRTRRGPTVGLIAIGCIMILSCALWIRNVFGAVTISVMGLVIAICGWKLKAMLVLYLYSFLAATCSFNALDSIQDLLGMTSGELYVNGQARGSDADTVAEKTGIPAQVWAILWLIFGVVMSLIGLFWAFDGNTLKREQKEGGQSVLTPKSHQLYPVTVV